MSLMPHSQGAYLSDNVADAAQSSEGVVLDDIPNVSGQHNLRNLRLLLLLLLVVVLLLQLLLLIVELFKFIIVQL